MAAMTAEIVADPRVRILIGCLAWIGVVRLAVWAADKWDSWG